MMAATSTTIETLEDPRNILELLRVQARLYARLESFAIRQRTLVTGDDVGPLLSLLADRQRLSEQMAHLGEALKPIRRPTRAVRLSQPIDRLRTIQVVWIVSMGIHHDNDGTNGRG
jgi:hypothetical protein